MKVKVRAVILHDGKLVAPVSAGRERSTCSSPAAGCRTANQCRGDRPGGGWERPAWTSCRSRLLYVAEVVGGYGVHDVTWCGLPKLREGKAMPRRDQPGVACNRMVRPFRAGRERKRRARSSDRDSGPAVARRSLGARGLDDRSE